MTKHTPGPWDVYSEGKTEECVVKFASDGIHFEPICDLYEDSGFEFPIDPTANANLIAAAPELLSALRGFLSMTMTEHAASCSSHIKVGKTGRMVKGCDCIMGKARVAIDNAEGRKA